MLINSPLTNDIGQYDGRDVLAQQGEDHTRYGYHNTELEKKRNIASWAKNKGQSSLVPRPSRILQKLEV